MLTPDDLLAGARPAGERVVVFDDDHYYLGGVLAELLVRDGRRVTLVTPAPRVSEWTVNTMEQSRIQRRLLELGVAIETDQTLLAADAGSARIASTYTGEERELACDALVLVTARLPRDELVRELAGAEGLAVRAIGDAWAPGTIAAAVWDGRRYAEELDAPVDPDGIPIRREVAQLAPLP